MSPSSSDASSAARGPRAASPWAHVVRGESEPSAAAPSSPPPPAAVIVVNSEAESSGSGDREVAESSSERSSENNGNGKRSAWSSKPPNGVMEVGPVMGAVSWPALGESSKAAPKLSLPDSIKAGGDDGSSASDSASPVSVVANHHQMKVNSNNPNHNSNRQKPTKRSGGGSGTSSNHGFQVNGGPISAPLPPSSLETQQQRLPDNPAGQRQEPSPRDMHSNRNHNNWDHGSSSKGSGFSPHSHGDHHRPFNRRGNNGGAGGPHNGGRRDPDRGGYSNHSNDWNNPSPRHMLPPSPRMHHPRPQFIRTPPPPPPAGAAPFIGPPPLVRPFVPPPMGFPAEIPPPVFYVPAPPPPAFVAAHPVAHAMPPAVLLNAADYQRPSVLKQIEYYFSNDNLCKDMYLRRHMDEQGWVPVALIAGFNRVRQLTNGIPNNINYILDLVRTSELVEVQGERIRRRGDWMIWILHPQPSPHGSTSSPHSPTMPNVDHVAYHMRNVALEDSTSNHNSGSASATVGRSASGDIINQSQRGDSNEERQG